MLERARLQKYSIFRCLNLRRYVPVGVFKSSDKGELTDKYGDFQHFPEVSSK